MARGNFGDWQDRSIITHDTIAAQDEQFVKSFAKYDVSNPHPGFGKDPNIINEYGHTLYPKWVYPEGKEAVIVNSADEEASVLGKEVKVKKPKADNGWTE